MKLKTVKVAIEDVCAPKVRMAEPKDTVKYFKELMEADREQMWILHVNSHNKLISKEMVSMGTLTRGISSPREIFKGALLQNAHGIIVGHSHPSTQSLKFSKHDIKFTKQLIKCGNVLVITVLDFILVNNKGEYSSLRLTKPKLFERNRR